MASRMPQHLRRVLPAAVVAALFLVASSAEAAKTSANYEQQSLSVTYEEKDGLPSFSVLNGTVTELDEISPKINLNKTEAVLNCASGFMNVALKFEQPFFGIVYADFDRNSACKITGNGKTEEKINLPLKGCGTLQSPARVFTNNIIVRFHPGLEIDGDEVITIVCRYPPPIVPTPVPPPLGIIQLPAAERPLQPLREFEILLIICAIIFLALLLLGIGCSYYCLKKRNIKVIRRRPASTLGSDVTKISEPISMFGGLKIPRAHAVDASGSEECEESVRTDFASEIGSVQSEEEYTSAYSDKMCVLAEGAVLHGLTQPPAPRFDANIVVRHDGKDVMTPVMSTASSESGTILNAQEQYLTTILERTETNTLETLEKIRNLKSKREFAVPVHARLNIRNKEISDASGTDVDTMSEYSKSGTEIYSEQEMELDSKQMRNFSIFNEGQDLQDASTLTRQQQQQQQQHRQYTTDDQYIDSSTTRHVMSGQHNQGYHPDSGAHASTSRHVMSSSSAQQHHQDFASSTIHQAVTSSGHHAVSHNRSNFDVLFRIVSEEPAHGGAAESSSHRDDLSSVFTSDERHAIRNVLETNEEITTELKRTYAREALYLVRNDAAVRERVAPEKWDVLIRVLGDEEVVFVQDESDASSIQSGWGSAAATAARFETSRQFQYATDTLPSIGSSTAFGEHRSTADRSGTEIIETHHLSEETRVQHSAWRS